MRTAVGWRVTGLRNSSRVLRTHRVLRSSVISYRVVDEVVGIVGTAERSRGCKRQYRVASELARPTCRISPFTEVQRSASTSYDELDKRPHWDATRKHCRCCLPTPAPGATAVSRQLQSIVPEVGNCKPSPPRAGYLNSPGVAHLRFAIAQQVRSSKASHASSSMFPAAGLHVGTRVQFRDARERFTLAGVGMRVSHRRCTQGTRRI